LEGVAAFVVGLFTRVTVVLTLVTFLSYYHRGPVLSSVTEPVVAFLLFYLCLGPCGAVLSVDAWRRRRAAGRPIVIPPMFTATVALRLIQVHTALEIGRASCRESGWSWAGGARLASK